MERTKEVQVTWNREERALSLEGEPVLRYTLAWPQVKGAGLGGRWISGYYAHLARRWRDRWEREVYWRACLELAARREEARPFTPWSGELSGETALLQDGILSLRFTGWEVRGDGRPARVRWGDVWTLREGSPKPLRALFRGEKGWKKRLWRSIGQQGEARRQSGDCFLDGDWEKKARDTRPLSSWCLSEDGVELAFPQCAAAPAAEGCPVFTIPLKPEQAE
ncbi:hypothetical protein N510_001624 [Firmicutes bacterium ASF500]|nr:hypothetical protein N510_001624 [Firmicutes bacterium ASF500]